MRTIYRLVASLVFLFCGLSDAQAQISLPKGNVIDTITHEELAYYETQLIFNTGKYRSSDYLYQKVSDSIPANWLVTACFNGDCHNQLNEKGKFISDFGINDTTCFIAFHVESFGRNGKCTIRYKIINSKNKNDTALLEINLTYVNLTGISKSRQQDPQFHIFPNPASNYVTISTEKTEDITFHLCDMQGKIWLRSLLQQTNQATINTAALPKGVYVLRVMQGEKFSVQKLVIQ